MLLMSDYIYPIFFFLYGRVHQGPERTFRCFYRHMLEIAGKKINFGDADTSRFHQNQQNQEEEEYGRSQCLVQRF